MKTLPVTARQARAGGVSPLPGRSILPRSQMLRPVRATEKPETETDVSLAPPRLKWNEQLETWLPEREPGAFPDLDVHPRGWEGVTVDDGDEEYDPLRDGPLRYLGYANELGEAFAAFLPAGGVPLSYAIAISYVLVDTFDKGRKAKVESMSEFTRKASALPPTLNPDNFSTILAAERTLDTVVWQLLASVAIPGFTIHQVVHYTHMALDPFLAHLSGWELQEARELASVFHMATATFVAVTDKAVPTMLGLAAIPFIVHPIDEGVHGVLDLTLRPLLRNIICKKMQGDKVGLDMCEECQPSPLASAAGEEGPSALSNALMMCIPLGLLIAAAQMEG